MLPKLGMCDDLHVTNCFTWLQSIPKLVMNTDCGDMLKFYFSDCGCMLIFHFPGCGCMLIFSSSQKYGTKWNLAKMWHE